MTETDIVVVPHPLIAPIDDDQLTRIQAAAGDSRVIVLREPVIGDREFPETSILFGDVQPALLGRMPNLRWVQSVGAGVDRIAPALADRNIRLTSAKGVVGVHLAEHAMALLLAITRGIATAIRHPGWEHRRNIREDQWELAGRTLAIVGYGGTGQVLGQLSRGFQFNRVVAVEPETVGVDAMLDRVYHPGEIELALSEADVVVLTVPLTATTRRLMDASRLAAMKPGSILINVSRGELVDEDALLHALESGHLFAAGLDVTVVEPLPEESPLWGREDVIITPHVAGGSPHRSDRVVDQFCENLRRWDRGDLLIGEFDFAKGY